MIGSPKEERAKVAGERRGWLEEERRESAQVAKSSIAASPDTMTEPEASKPGICRYKTDIDDCTAIDFTLDSNGEQTGCGRFESRRGTGMKQALKDGEQV